MSKPAHNIEMPEEITLQLTDALARIAALESLQQENERLRAENELLAARRDQPQTMTFELPDGETRARRHQQKLERKMALLEERRRTSAAALASGPRRFTVGLYDLQGRVMNPERVVGADSPLEAEHKYRGYFGITATVHRFEANELEPVD